MQKKSGENELKQLETEKNKKKILNQKLIKAMKKLHQSGIINQKNMVEQAFKKW